MTNTSNKKTALLATAAAVLALSASTVWAQTTTTTPANTTGNTTAAARADASKIARADSGMLGDLAQNNRAEIEAGQMALEKSQNADVKKFAQMMIDDHTKALTEVESLAQSKNVKLPDGVGAVHKTKSVALKALTGNTFDSQYAKRAGVGDHESTLKLLKKMKTDGKDADVKALADKMTPTVEHHLEMAKQLASAK